MKKNQEKSDSDFVTGAFQALSASEVSPQLARKVATIPLLYPREKSAAWWPFGRIWQPALALVAAGMVGAVSGPWVLPADRAAEPEAEPEALAFVAAQEEEGDLDGLFALATASDWQEEGWELLEEGELSTPVETLQ